MLDDLLLEIASNSQESGKGVRMEFSFIYSEMVMTYFEGNIELNVLVVN